MDVWPPYLRQEHEHLVLAVKLQPRASANEIVGALGGELRIRVTAPPVDARANEALIAFLADCLGCPRRQIELARGHTSRHKLLRISGVEGALVLRRLEEHQGDRSGRAATAP